jgi:hypothetical protein
MIMIKIDYTLWMMSINVYMYKFWDLIIEQNFLKYKFILTLCIFIHVIY